MFSTLQDQSAQNALYSVCGAGNIVIAITVIIIRLLLLLAVLQWVTYCFFDPEGSGCYSSHFVFICMWMCPTVQLELHFRVFSVSFCKCLSVHVYFKCKRMCICALIKVRVILGSNLWMV